MMYVKTKRARSSPAFLLIRCEIMQQEEILKRLRGMDSVLEVYPTTGAYNIIAKIALDENQYLSNIILSNFATLFNMGSVIALESKVSTDINQILLDDSSKEHDYTDCPLCGVALPHCHCTCPFCGKRDGCECALFDAATGG